MSILNYYYCYQGIVKNGKVELEQGVQLPEGTVVQVQPVVAPGEDPLIDLPDEAVPTGIPDLAAEHDHYLYGTPKSSG